MASLAGEPAVLGDESLKALRAHELDGGSRPSPQASASSRISGFSAAHTQPESRHEQLPDELYQRVVLKLFEETAAGDVRELGHLEARAAGLGMRPLSLLSLGVRQVKAPEVEKKKGGGAGA